MPFLKRAFFVGFGVVFIAALFLGIFSPSAPRVFLNHRRAVESIRKLNRAEYNYSGRHPDAGFARTLSDLGEQGSEPESGLGPVDQSWRPEQSLRTTSKSDVLRVGAKGLQATQSRPLLQNQEGPANMRCARTKTERFGTAKTLWRPIASRCINQSSSSTGE